MSVQAQVEDDNTYVPEVYDAYTTSRVMTMEWIDGVKVCVGECVNFCDSELCDETVHACMHTYMAINVWDIAL